MYLVCKRRKFITLLLLIFMIFSAKIYAQTLNAEQVQPFFAGTDTNYTLIVTSHDGIEVLNPQSERVLTFKGFTDSTATSYKAAKDLSYIIIGYENGSLCLYSYDVQNNQYVFSSFTAGSAPVTNIEVNDAKDAILATSGEEVFTIELEKQLTLERPQTQETETAEEPQVPEPEEVPETPEEPEAEEPETTEEEPPQEETPEEEPKYEALAMIRYRNTDAIGFRLKVSYIPKPYIVGISLAAGYTCYTLIQPFYFGGYLEPHIGIPQKKFPYTYQMDGSQINGPLIMGGKIYAPFGICVFPFQKNIEVFVEVEPGLTLDMLWNAKFGKKSIISKMFPAFYCGLRTGATYKGFTVFAEGNYDAILGFGVSLGVGYNLNVHFFTSKETE